MFQYPGYSKVEVQLKPHLERMKKKNPDMIVLLRSPTHENEIKKTLAKCSAFLNSLQKKMRIY